jgi:hypothetical protein
MKLAITMISNRPKMAYERWLNSVHKLDKLLDRVPTSFSFVFEEPFTQELALPFQKLGRVVLKKKRKDKIFNWWPDRNEVCRNAAGAQYWLMTDDDCRFGGPTPLGYESWRRYHDAIKYLDAHPSCGGVICLPFLGGSASGSKIMVAHRELFALGSGLLLRNVSKQHSFFYSMKVFDRAGALDEPAACFSRIEKGYYIARTFNTPTARPPTKRVQPGPEAHPTYNSDMINSVGIGSVIRNRYDDHTWDHNTRRIPHGCLQMNLKANPKSVLKNAPR